MKTIAIEINRPYVDGFIKRWAETDGFGEELRLIEDDYVYGMDFPDEADAEECQTELVEFLMRHNFYLGTHYQIRNGGHYTGRQFGEGTN